MPSTASSTSFVRVGSSIPEGSEIVIVDDHSSLPERGSSASQVQGDGNGFPGVPSSFIGQSTGASSSHGSAVPSLAMRGPFGGNVAQTTMEASSMHPDPPLPPPAESSTKEELLTPEQIISMMDHAGSLPLKHTQTSGGAFVTAPGVQINTSKVVEQKDSTALPEGIAKISL